MGAKSDQSSAPAAYPTSLPFELIDQIISLVPEDVEDISSLISCNNVSPIWHAATRPHMFRFVNVQNQIQSARFFEMVSCSPEIPSLVRKMGIDSAKGKSGDWNAMEWFLQLPKEDFVNLKELRFRGVTMTYPGLHIPPDAFSFPIIDCLSFLNIFVNAIKDLLYAITNSRIHTLRFHWIYADGDLEIQPMDVKTFPPSRRLRTLDFGPIVNLELDERIWTWMCTPGILPLNKLSILRPPEVIKSRSTTLAQLAPTLSRLALQYDGEINEAGHSQLSLDSLNNLRSIRFSSRYWFRMVLPYRSTSLESMEINLVECWSPAQLDWTHLYTDIQACHLPSLKTIKFILPRSESTTTEAEFTERIKAIFCNSHLGKMIEVTSIAH